ncbi:MAG: hypothetical protein KDJ35_08885 [Alphaproteobacteria bacterium]|nr:hypothetical protein [Alphaproteobacteria bacterium]
MTASISKFTLEHGSTSDLLISDLLLGWNEFEKRHGRREFCDFNVSGHNLSKTYNSYDEIKFDLDKAFDAQDVQACPITMKRLISLQEHFNIRTNRNGVDLKNHHFKAIGFTPTMIDEKIIKSLRVQYEEAAQNAGISPFSFSKQQIQKDVIIPKNKIETQLQDFFKDGKKQIEALTGAAANFSVKYDIRSAPNETWYWWIDGYKRQLKLSINTHYTKDAALSELYVSAHHELSGHGIYYSYMADRLGIETAQPPKNKDPIHSGITTVIGPEVVAAEAVAEIVPTFLEATKNKIMLADTAYSYYRRAVLNNICATYKYHGADAMYEYGMQNTDIEEENLHNLLKTRVKNFETGLVELSYIPVYGAVHFMFRQALDYLPREDFKSILKTCYLNYLLPEDLNALMKEKGVPEHALLNTDNPALTL